MSSASFDLLDFFETIVSNREALERYQADPKAYLISQGCPPHTREHLTLLGMGTLLGGRQNVPDAPTQISTVMVLSVKTSEPDGVAQAPPTRIPITELDLTFEGAESFTVDKGPLTLPVDQQRSLVRYDPATAEVAFSLVLVFDPETSLTLSSGQPIQGETSGFPDSLTVVFHRERADLQRQGAAERVFGRLHPGGPAQSGCRHQPRQEGAAARPGVGAQIGRASVAP